MEFVKEFIKNNYYFAVLLIVCVSFAWVQLDKIAVEDHYMEIVVNEGDTLWQLASNYSEDIPTTHWIEQVRSLNELPTDQIVSGELLRVPVKINKQTDIRVAEIGVGTK